MKKARQCLRVAAACKETYFSKGDLRCIVQGTCVCSTGPTKRDECGCDLLPLREPPRPIKGGKNKVAYWWQPSTNDQSRELGPHSALRVNAGNWAPVNIVVQDEAPILMEPQKKKKQSPASFCLWDPGRSAIPAA